MTVNTSPSGPVFDVAPEAERRGNYIRLRTIIWLRWVAVLGQLSALVIAEYIYGIEMMTGPIVMVIGTSILANLIAMFIFPESRRLSERENFFMVLFDLLQLGLLLFLAGGLNNPFSLLIVGPVAVSAGVLNGRSVITLGAITVLIATALTQIHMPMIAPNGMVMRIPSLFIFGTWAAVIIAVLFLGVYVRRIASDANAMSDAFQAAQLALSREQKLTDLGGVVAAAAHELGTPLATIKLTSSELLDDQPDGSDIREDLLLIQDQADRCRDILHSMGRAGKEDRQIKQAPISAIVEEAAQPHAERGKALHIETTGEGDQPEVLRRPEIIHSLRNLIQNAVDFARENVWIGIEWDEEQITLRIQDDGRGYPAAILGRIGEPFMRRRPAQGRTYEGMGLGLFIAKTLLERTGAELEFANGTSLPRSGAVVVVRWPTNRLAIGNGTVRPSLGENTRF